MAYEFLKCTKQLNNSCPHSDTELYIRAKAHIGDGAATKDGETRIMDQDAIDKMYERNCRACDQ